MPAQRPTHISFSGSPKSPSVSAAAGRIPIAAFMALATPLLCVPAQALVTAIDGILKGVSTVLEKGLEDIGEELSRSLSKHSKN